MNDIKENKKVGLTGGGAAAEALRQINPDVMAAYPITPQTPIIETFAKIRANGKVETEIIPVESEHSAMSACVGSSAAGARTVTATSSQGLALMNEILYIASGARLPILMLISSRALSAPINIHCDYSDVMGARDSGWIQIFSATVQEVYDNTIMGLKLAEKVELPVMVIMDGFITSHSVETLNILPDDEVKKFVGEYNPSQYLLDLENPLSYGPVGLPNSYFEFKLDQEKAIDSVDKEFKKIRDKFFEMSGRDYDIYEKYKLEDAEFVVVASGSTTDMAKDVVDKLRAKKMKAGLLRVNLFRPFLHDKIAKALSKAKYIGVLDRSLSFGTMPPLYGEIVTSLWKGDNFQPKVASYIYGLGGRDIFAKDIEKVFDDLERDKIYSKSVYITGR